MRAHSHWLERQRTDQVPELLDQLGSYSMHALDGLAAEIQSDLSKSREQAGVASEKQLSATRGLRTAIDGVHDALADFAASSTVHLQQILWAELSQLEVLVGIEDALRNPRAVEAEELLKMGRQCIVSEMLPEAIRLLTEASQKNPLDYRVYVTRALIHQSCGDHDSATQDLMLALRNARDDDLKAEAHYLLGRVTWEIGNHAVALEHFAQAQPIELDSVEAKWRDGDSSEVRRSVRSSLEYVRCLGDWRTQGEADDIPQQAIMHADGAMDNLLTAPSIWPLVYVDPLVRNVPGAIHRMRAAIAQAQNRAREILASFQQKLGAFATDDDLLKQALIDLSETSSSEDYAKLVALPSRVRTAVERQARRWSDAFRSENAAAEDRAAREAANIQRRIEEQKSSAEAREQQMTRELSRLRRDVGERKRKMALFYSLIGVGFIFGVVAVATARRPSDAIALTTFGFLPFIIARVKKGSLGKGPRADEIESTVKANDREKQLQSQRLNELQETIVQVRKKHQEQMNKTRSEYDARRDAADRFLASPRLQD